MWRVVILLAGCNNLLGIHEIGIDAGTDEGRCSLGCECTVDEDCADPKAVCLDEVQKSACVCSAGYTAGASGCAWSGVVVDPAFTNPANWQTTTNAMVNGTAPMETGMMDPGAVHLTSGNACREVGRVLQSIVMPKRARSEPLVTVMSYQSAANGFGGRYTSPALGIGPVWNDSGWPYHNGWSTAKRCLGAGQYAAPATKGRGAAVDLAATIYDEYCKYFSNTSTMLIDHIDIRPADPMECPEPGVVVNGNAEGTTGWSFTGDAGYYTNVDGTKSIRLTTPNVCSSSSTRTPMSVPIVDATGSAMFSLYHSTNAYLSLYLDLDKPLQLNGTMTETYCVPAPLRGAVFDFSANLYGGGGTCSTASGNSEYLDNLTVANDPRCGTDPRIADPGFESGLGLVSAFAEAGQASVTTTTTVAHTGARSLRLLLNDACTYAYHHAWVVTPEPLGDEGPAVTFWYRVPATNGVFTVYGYGAQFTGIKDDTWRQGKVCLDPVVAGRASQVLFYFTHSATTCAPLATPDPAYVDDIEVINDPACPIN